MTLTRRIATPGSSSRRRWLFVVFVVLSVATVLFALTRPTLTPASEPGPALSRAPTPQMSAAPSGGAQPETLKTAAAVEAPDSYGAPRTMDFRKLAAAAATAIYTWDTRRASYSEVYSGLRNWWHVLPDGSNPLAVFVQEFEATGINAGTYQFLAGQRAYRSATAESVMCDSELAKVRERPAPWTGLHVCTISLRILDQSISARNMYTAPVSVMVNCPPAASAPADHCIMVGFYAAPNRVLY
ncbi:hypothetical protein JOE40_000666 [Arthrobacter sp. PvP102]|nr:hypothetical protein [Arthrobacter sp. PvP103]MBP1236157.1 hypothetical protein [Arthrobacter sp. PvP102]